MGKIISAITDGIDGIVGAITSTVTDAAATAAQLTTLATSFAVTPSPSLKAPALKGYAVGLHKNHAFNRSLLLSDDQQDIGPLIKSTMKAALAKSQNVFASTYTGDTGIHSDNGLVNNYCGNGADAQPSDPTVEAAIVQLKQQLSQNFMNWQFPVNDDMLQNMAQTMVLEVFTKAGTGDTSVGTYSISNNQSIDWTLTYGLFSITESPSTQGLIYAFSAAFNSGF